MDLKYDGSIYSLDEIANYMGISKERVRQIEISAIKKIQNPKFNKFLWEYMKITSMTDNCDIGSHSDVINDYENDTEFSPRFNRKTEYNR